LGHPLSYSQLTRFLVALLVAFALPARAVDGVSGELGRGSHDVDVWRVGVQWKQEPRFLAGGNWHLSWELSLGGWNPPAGNNVYDLGLTPVLRYSPSRPGTFVEGAIGAHLLSDSQIERDFTLSTRFQFGDHVGVGYDFGGYDLSVRLQHLSNGGIRNPNPGVNFLVLRVQWHLQ